MICWQCGGTGTEGSSQCYTCSGIGKVFLQGDGIIPVDERTQRETVRLKNYIGAETTEVKVPMSTYDIVVFTEDPKGGKLIKVELPIQPQVGHILWLTEPDMGSISGIVTEVAIHSDKKKTLTFMRRTHVPKL